MPGVAAAPPPSGVVGDPAVDYANAVAKAIGLDPRVAYAWQKAEGDPGDLPGYYNYMNIKTTTAQSLGIPVVGTGPAGTAKFANVTVGEQAAIAEIQSRAIGITNERGKSIAQQISDIASSPWASSHYSPTPKVKSSWGVNLLHDFTSMYPGVDVGTSSQTPLPAAGGGQSAAQTAAPNPLSPITDAIGSITKAFDFLFSYRFLEILGGGVLILAGLYVLARQFQQTFPDPLGVGKRAVEGEKQEKAAKRETESTARSERAASAETRRQEAHTVRLKTEQARATELRTRTRHRAKVASNSSKERAKLERSAYIRGAADREGF